MNTQPDRDQMLDAQLRRSIRAAPDAPSSPACLDAETMAAWVDGGLDRQAAAMAETHVSSCGRCQARVGLIAKSVPDVSTIVAEPWWRRYRAGWMIPLTAGVAAVGLWMIVPTERTAPPPMQVASAPARAEAPAQAMNATAETPDPAVPRKDQPLKLAKKNEAKLEDRQFADETRAAERTVAAPPALAEIAPKALGRMVRATASREILSPDPRIRWRLLDSGNIEISSDGGATWEVTSTGATAPLTAGSSPSAGVCWIVGGSGTVLLTTDGRGWRRVAFPEVVDLAGVQATGARKAAVSAVDGRVFRTTDAGASWTQP